MSFYKNGVDLDTIFEPRVTSPTSAAAFLNNSTDLNSRYEAIANGSNVGYDVGFKLNTNDIRNIFAAKGTVTGYLYDATYCYFEMHYYWNQDGKAWGTVFDHVDVIWGGVNKYSSATSPSVAANLYSVVGSDSLTYTMDSQQAGGASYTYDAGTAQGNVFLQRFKVKRGAASPFISSFYADATNLTAGVSTLLHPNFSGGTGVIGTTGSGSTQVTASATSGATYSVSPSSSTTYTLTVGGSTTATVAITVFAAPTITSITASASPVNDGTYVNITPNFSAPGGAGSVSGIGTVSSGTSYSVLQSNPVSTGTWPTITNTYTLNAYNGAGTYASSQSVSVVVYKPPSILSGGLGASPSSILSGDGSILTPHFEGSTGFIGTSGTGSYQVTSNATNNTPITVYPTVTTTYTLTAYNFLGLTTTTTALVTVTAGCGSYCKLDGGCCPAPEVLVTMADGTYKQAGDLEIGDIVASWNERIDSIEPEHILSLKYSSNYRMKLYLDNGLSGSFAKNHRFLTYAEGWKELKDLVPGEQLSKGFSVVKVEDDGIGPVVQLTVHNNHTYLTLGVISHNTKGLS